MNRLVFAAAVLVLANCSPAQKNEPAPMTGFVSDKANDLFGYYLPLHEIRVGKFKLDPAVGGLFPPYLPLGILNRTRPVLDQAPCTDQPEGIVPLTHRTANWASRPPIAPRSQLRRNIQNETARQAARCAHTCTASDFG